MTGRATDNRAAKRRVDPKVIIRQAIKDTKRAAKDRRAGMTYAEAADAVVKALHRGGWRIERDDA